MPLYFSLDFVCSFHLALAVDIGLLGGRVRDRRDGGVGVLLGEEERQRAPSAPQVDDLAGVRTGQYNTIRLVVEHTHARTQIRRTNVRFESLNGCSEHDTYSHILT